jgi:brefeldin A-inhibited guanine nucleotide-exchange protein
MDRLAVEVIKDFIALDPETQPRNVTAWTPVVTDVLRGSIEFEEVQVSLSFFDMD